MDNECFAKQKKELQRLEMLRQNTLSRLSELERYRDITLRPYTVRSRNYYYAKKKYDDSARYLGNDCNEDVIGIKEYRYLKQLLSDLDAEIELTRIVLKTHRPLDHDSINARLPKAYRNASLISLLSPSEAAAEWKRQKEAEKSRYPVKHPEKLIMTAIDGTKLRSKSEMNIANLYVLNGIPYVYELPHFVNGILIYSDFTALSLKDYKTEIITEHEGLMNDVNYQRVLLQKINTYIAGDLIPGRDVFFTFDDLKGGFDTSPVQGIIDMKLKPDR